MNPNGQQPQQPASTQPYVQPTYAQPQQPMQPPSQAETLSSFIPYKNMPALLSYYMGVFGLIPFLGIPLSIAAVVLGFIGLNKHKVNPSSKGKSHAIVGIVLGIVELVIFTGFVILTIPPA